jgi:predicted DNA-binding transcriptional regulator AlpA
VYGEPGQFGSLRENSKMATEYLSSKQAAARFGLSQSWLAKLRIYGGGPIYMKCGKRILYEESKFEDWLESRQCNSTSEY